MGQVGVVRAQTRGDLMVDESIALLGVRIAKFCSHLYLLQTLIQTVAHTFINDSR